MTTTPLDPEALGLDAVSQMGTALERRGELVQSYLSPALELLGVERSHDDEDRAVLLLLAVTLLWLADQGSTRLPVAGPEGKVALRAAFAALLGPDAELSALIERSVSLIASAGERLSCIGSTTETAPLIVAEGHLYTQRIYSLETRLVQSICEITTESTSSWEAADISAMLEQLLGGADERTRRKSHALKLSKEQQLAVLTSLHAPLSVITGGPGTGKTSVVISLLRALFLLGRGPTEIALTAPTGKAATRLSASIQEQLAALRSLPPLERQMFRSLQQPRTIHRLLGFSPSSGRFRFDRRRRLQQNVIIVDEVSMVGLELMTHLLDAVQQGAKVVLIGDPNQLPSVDAGAVLRDLLQKNPKLPPWAAVIASADDELDPEQAQRSLHTVELTHNFRVDSDDEGGRAVAAVSEQAMHGEVSFLDDESLVRKLSSVGEVRFEGVELLDATNSLSGFLDRWFVEGLGTNQVLDWLATPFQIEPGGFTHGEPELRALVKHLDLSRILCLTHGGSAGTESINSRLHGLMARHLGERETRPLLQGEPIIVLRNDYERQLFNGDTGILVDVRLNDDRVPRLMAVFPRPDGSLVAHHPDALRGHVALAHAVTVHKSQGSEFDHVAFVLPTRDGPLSSREAVYTALTRARKSVVVVGDERLLQVAIRRSAQRYSGLAERLATLTHGPRDLTPTGEPA